MCALSPSPLGSIIPFSRRSWIPCHQGMAPDSRIVMLDQPLVCPDQPQCAVPEIRSDSVVSLPDPAFFRTLRFLVLPQPRSPSR